MKLQEKYFTHKSEKLQYYQGGSGQTVIFLHGGGVTALTYIKIIELLSKKYLVIAPNLPGFGKSTLPENAETYPDILVQFVNSLESNNIVLMGHSLGGLMALEIALRCTKVDRLILLDPAGIPVTSPKVVFLYKLFLEKTVRSILLFQNVFVMFLMKKELFRNIFTRLFEYPRLISIVEKILRDGFGYFEKITVPTLILWGESDELFPKKNAELMSKQITNSQVKYVRGNHDWCLFKPEIVIDHCSLFIGQ